LICVISYLKEKNPHFRDIGTELSQLFFIANFSKKFAALEMSQKTSELAMRNAQIVTRKCRTIPWSVQTSSATIGRQFVWPRDVQYSTANSGFVHVASTEPTERKSERCNFAHFVIVILIDFLSKFSTNEWNENKKYNWKTNNMKCIVCVTKRGPNLYGIFYVYKGENDV
jgi:hypothetical protein